MLLHRGCYVITKESRKTEKGLEARRRNGQRSRGPVTSEGKARCRQVKEQHGFYSKSEDATLRTLGEDPANFQAVLEGLRATWAPENPAQDKLLSCLARTFCRIELAERARPGHLLRQAREADDGRETRLHAQMMHLKMTADSLRLLAQSVAHKHYVASLDDHKKMKTLHEEGAMKGMGEIALALIFQLREPGTAGLGEGGEYEDQVKKRHQVMNKIRAIFGLEPLPEEAEGEGEEEEPVEEAEMNTGLRTALESPQDAEAPRIDAGSSSGAEQGLAGKTEAAPEIIPAQACLDAAANNSEEAEEPNMYPKISKEEWEAREPVRQLLENILTQQVDIYEARRKALLKELVVGPSP